MATLKITFSDDVLAALRTSRSITIALDSSKAAATGAGRRGKAGSGDNGFRPGSLPDRLLKWAAGRKEPFAVADVMKKLRVKRAHASMVLTKAVGSGHLRRVGRGAYASV